MYPDKYGTIFIWLKILAGKLYDGPTEAIPIKILTKSFYTIEEALNTIRTAIVDGADTVSDRVWFYKKGRHLPVTVRPEAHNDSHNRQMIEEKMKTIWWMARLPRFIALEKYLQVRLTHEREVEFKLNTSVIEEVILSSGLKKMLNFRGRMLNKERNIGLPIQETKLFFIYGDDYQMLSVIPLDHEKKDLMYFAPFRNYLPNITHIFYRTPDHYIVNLPEPWYLIVEWFSMSL